MEKCVLQTNGKSEISIQKDTNERIKNWKSKSKTKTGKRSSKQTALERFKAKRHQRSIDQIYSSIREFINDEIREAEKEVLASEGILREIEESRKRGTLEQDYGPNFSLESDCFLPLPGEEKWDEFQNSRLEFKDDLERKLYRARKSKAKDLMHIFQVLVKDYMNENFFIELGGKADWGPKWLSKIRNLRRTKFVEIYGYLVNTKLKANPETRKITKAAGGKIYENEYKTWGDWEDAIVVPDIDKMAESLSLSKSLIYKYLKAFCQDGFLKALPNKVGRGGKTVYSIGKRKPIFSKESKEYFGRVFIYLKNDKENRAKLADFAL